jgi:hypothetical protein
MRNGNCNDLASPASDIILSEIPFIFVLLTSHAFFLINLRVHIIHYWFLCDTVKRLPSCTPQQHRTARAKPL